MNLVRHSKLEPACVILLLAIFAPTARAEQPTAAYIFPAGGQRGTTIDARVGGHFFNGKANFEMIGPGVSAPATIEEMETVWFDGPVVFEPMSSAKEDYPRDHGARITIAEGAAAGARLWRVWNSQGATAALKFFVGEYPEITEQEFEGDAIPVPVTLPVTINGRVFPRQDIDSWSFEAKAGQSITCIVAAQQLVTAPLPGTQAVSQLDAHLEVRDANDHLLTEAFARAGGDPRLTFRAPADGLYQVRIQDVNLGGFQHYVYRLTITAGPLVDHVFPLGGQRGTEVAFELIGQQTPTELQKLTIPADAPARFEQRFMIAGQPANPIALDLDSLPEFLEIEPNDEPAQAAPRAVPAVFNGRIARAGDVDFWSMELKKGDKLEFDLRANRLGSPLDSVVTVLDSEGKVAAQNDDLGGGQSDSRLALDVPADGVYRVRVADRFAARGGPQFGYRLRIAPPAAPAPDFQLKLNASAVTVVRDLPPPPDGAEKPVPPKRQRRQPGAAVLGVHVDRSGGLQGEIELAVEGLPPGVKVEGTKIPANGADAQLRFSAPHTTTISAGRITVRGSCKVMDQSVTRTAQFPGDANSPPLDQVLVAVAIRTPFVIDGEYESDQVPRGSVYRRSFRLDRGGYDGPLIVRMSEKQPRHLQGVNGPTETIPPGAASFEYGVTVPPWGELGHTSRSVLMLTGVIKDHDGSEHRVSYASEEQDHQIVAIMEAGQLSIECDHPAVVISPGKSADVAVTVRRAKAIAGAAARVELVSLTNLKGIAAEPVTLAPGQSTATITIRFAADAAPPSAPVRLRATTIDPRSPHVAETDIELVSVPTPSRNASE